MREQKFKFWDTIDKKFIEDRDNVFINGLGVVYYGYTDIEIDQVAKELIPVQFTGLKDKNGKEIYEGDVVKSTLNETKLGAMEFKNGRFQVSFGNRSMLFCYENRKNLEIIGNIYEKPELAEEK